MNISVLKFGGTSQLFTTYKMIKDIIENRKEDHKYIIVLSAVSGITNKLLEFINSKSIIILNEIISINKNLASQCFINIDDLVNKFLILSNNLNNLNDKIKFVAQGEYFTTEILNRYLINSNIKSKLLSSQKIIFSTSENTSMYNKGEFNVNSSKIIKNFNKNIDTLIIPGFSGSTPLNYYCLLGRGGSDTSGSIIAASINAKVYEIWTDVNGIYSSDPRKIKNTIINKEIDYEVAQEVAAMGAKVIHPYCIIPCAIKSIPIYIKNTFDPYCQSTIINNNKKNNLYGITIQDNVNVFKITSFNMWNNYGFASDILSVFGLFSVGINIINTSQFNITTTTDEQDSNKLLSIKNKLEEKYQVELTHNNSIISIVGNKIKLIDKFINNIGHIFNFTKNYDIITTSYSSNDLTLSFVINSHKNIELAQGLHDILFN